MEVLSYIEIRAGKIRPAGLESLTVGRQLADASGGTLTALAVGNNIQNIEQLENYGPDLILTVDDQGLANYSPRV